MSLLITIFLLVLLIKAIRWVEKPLFNLATAIHSRTLDANASKTLRDLRKSILENQKKLAQTSSQDEFAKWAKLRRKLDKGISDLGKLNDERSAKEDAFSLKFHAALWIFTTGLELVILWWYRKEVVFYVPRRWFGPAEWLLALPYAPRGAVSSSAWQLACQRTIKVVERVVRDLSLHYEKYPFRLLSRYPFVAWLKRDTKTKSE